MGAPDDHEMVTPADRGEWRAWLAANHATSPGVWLVYFKKGSGLGGVSYGDAVEEAICFGWIDSRVRSMDDARYRQLYTPRRPGSIWSRLNRERVERVIAAGIMTGAGLEKVEAAKADGSWSMIDAADDLVVPDDLLTALEADPTAAENFEAFPDSAKKTMLWWVYSAKRESTRAGRVQAIVAAASEGLTVADHRERR